MGLSDIYHTVDAKWVKLNMKKGLQLEGLWIFFFHTLLENPRYYHQHNLFPHEYMTVAKFRLLISYFIDNGFQFISPTQLQDISSQRNTYAMITFDDGYYNNHLCLPVLEEYQIPAVFNIATDYTEHPRSFWWDVHYRVSKTRGKSMKNILSEQQELKKLSYYSVEERLKSECGENAFLPIGDMDRPFTASELKDFAQSPYVYLGNHTHHHAILPHLSYDALTYEIQSTQKYLHQLTGTLPHVIAYPNGNFSEKVIPFLSNQFLQFGFTVIAGINSLESLQNPTQALQLKRFQPNGLRKIENQCIQIHGYQHSMKRWLSRHKTAESGW